jgi:hypothetical protein
MAKSVPHWLDFHLVKLQEWRKKTSIFFLIIGRHRACTAADAV